MNAFKHHSLGAELESNWLHCPMKRNENADEDGFVVVINEDADKDKMDIMIRFITVMSEFDNDPTVSPLS